MRRDKEEKEGGMWEAGNQERKGREKFRSEETKKGGGEGIWNSGNQGCQAGRDVGDGKAGTEREESNCEETEEERSR